MRLLNRRQFLALSASSTGAVMLSQCDGCWRSPGSACRPVGDHRDQIQANPELQNNLPKLYISSNGHLELDLEASARRMNLGGTSLKALSYNGQIPGPRLEVKPGDTVRIRFQNNLIEPTNVHYHGLHIPPTGKADNVFLRVTQGETVTYEFTIPKQHPGGIAYYHPHLHGYVAAQVLGGLGGIFVV